MAKWQNIMTETEVNEKTIYHFTAAGLTTEFGDFYLCALYRSLVLAVRCDNRNTFDDKSDNNTFIEI